MGFGIRLKVWGDYACFTRPEMKVERVSYDVMTPSAARGILEAIHWKPAIFWVVDRIEVLNEIRFDNIRRNEVKSKISAASVQKALSGAGDALSLTVNDGDERQQRAAMVVRDPAYVIHAHFILTDKAGETDTPEKHYNIFLRRARNGECFMQPYMGCREFPAHFQLLEDGDNAVSFYSGSGARDLGWMLQDIDFQNDMTPRFFRATMSDGVVDIPAFVKEGAGQCR